MEYRASLTSAEREIARIEARRKKLIAMVLDDDLPAAEIKDELVANAARRDELKRKLEMADEPPPLLHPQMSDVYRERVMQLCQALQQEESRTEASEAIHQLVEAIILEPEGETLAIRLKGDLAAMLAAAQNAKRPPDSGDLLVSIQLVAGARNHHYCARYPVCA